MKKGGQIDIHVSIVRGLFAGLGSGPQKAIDHAGKGVVPLASAKNMVGVASHIISRDSLIQKDLTSLAYNRQKSAKVNALRDNCQ